MKRSLKILLTIFAFSMFTVALLPAILNGTLASPVAGSAVGGWYQQFMPNLGGKTIQDLEFKDSLTGFATARQTGDSSYFIRTLDGGDNWQIVYRSFLAMTQIQFVNTNTGYAVGAYLFKTVNGGLNWSQVTAPSISPEELYVISEDTIWIISSNSLTGGVYRTTNGGASWEQQINLGSSNPEKIYMYNQRIGYISKNQGSSGYVRKTTDGGNTWNLIVNNDYYLDINFTDSLKGWKCSVFGMKMTTNGGTNWVTQTLPQGGIISVTGITSFHNINKDTIFGVGGYVIYPNNQVRGMLYRTIDGGNTWLFQIPDTSIHIGGYSMIAFINKNNGWAYNIATGIHTTTGGDPVWLTDIKQISSEVPKEFKLYQNYPNPFNPSTNIKYQITKNNSIVRLTVFDITGREIVTLVNAVQQAGTYEVDFSGSNYSSGVYFYSLTVEGIIMDNKNMILLK